MENQEIMNNGLASTETNENTEVKTYTEEEVLKLVQSEADKRVSQALKTQQAKFEKKMTEAEKLHNMDESQRETFKLQQRIAELEEMNKNFLLSENKATLAKAMSERNLPVSFVDYLVADDADVMMENLSNFEKQFNAAVNDRVSSQLAKGSKGVKASTSAQMGLTKEEFNKMTLKQQSELYHTNKQLYLELSGR